MSLLQDAVNLLIGALAIMFGGATNKKQRDKNDGDNDLKDRPPA
jgi:hypothetical protein